MPLEGTQPMLYEALTVVFPTTHLLGPLSTAHIKLYASALETPAAATPSVGPNVPVFFCIACAHGVFYLFYQ